MTARDSGGGGMTGATGDLTPDDAQREFEPGELREVSNPMHHADVTKGQAPTSETDDAGGDQADAYGSEHSGGDDVSDHEEHF